MNGSFFGEQTWAYGFPNPNPDTSDASPVLAASGTETFGASVAYGWSATSWASAYDGALHAYANGNILENCSNCVSSTFESVGNFNVDWYDTLFISGLSSGTPVDLMVTTALNSTVNSSGLFGANAKSNVTIKPQHGLSQEVSVTNSGADNGPISQSMIVVTKAGAELQLLSELMGGASAGINGGGSAFATSDASDTANTYITVLTPGASYTTASGVTYSPVPEPRSFWLLALLLPIIWAGARRRRT